MTLIDDIRAVRARTDQAQTDMDALIGQMVDALFTRLRPLAAIAWLDDTNLRAGCVAFVQEAVTAVTKDDPRPITAGRALL